MHRVMCWTGRDATNYTNLKSWVPTEFRKQRGRGGVTYMCFEGCHRRLGCTLVRRARNAWSSWYFALSHMLSLSVVHKFGGHIWES